MREYFVIALSEQGVGDYPLNTTDKTVALERAKWLWDNNKIDSKDTVELYYIAFVDVDDDDPLGTATNCVDIYDRY